MIQKLVQTAISCEKLTCRLILAYVATLCCSVVAATAFAHPAALPAPCQRRPAAYALPCGQFQARGSLRIQGLVFCGSAQAKRLLCRHLAIPGFRGPTASPGLRPVVRPSCCTPLLARNSTPQTARARAVAGREELCRGFFVFNFAGSVPCRHCSVQSRSSHALIARLANLLARAAHAHARPGRSHAPAAASRRATGAPGLAG